MSQQIKILYRNILENSTVAVTSENSSFPAWRLYDRAIDNLFKGNSTPANFYITADQGVTIQYDVDRLLIPPGHNLDGLTIKVQYSTDNFAADINDAVSWVQSGSGLIDKSFTSQNKRYWRLNIASPASAPELAEMFLGKTYTFAVNPLYGARQGRKRNIFSDETRSGYDRDVKFGELRKFRAYEFKNSEDADQAELEAVETHCEGVKPVWLEDHKGNVFFAKMTNEEDFGLDNEDGAVTYYSHRREFREVLGR